MKRVLICIMIACLLTSGITMLGCGKKVDEAALIAEVKLLLPKTMLINRLFHEEGLPVKKSGQVIAGYTEVDMDKIRALGYENLEEILADMDGVWTEGYIQRFRESSLFTTVSAGSSQISKYCYDQYNIKTDAYEGIWVSTDGLETKTDPVEFLVDSLAVVEVQTKNRVRMSVQVLVTDGEDPTATQTRQITFTVARVNKTAPWLLDTSTAVKYSDKMSNDIGG